jgi:hypothetical protein
LLLLLLFGLWVIADRLEPCVVPVFPRVQSLFESLSFFFETRISNRKSIRQQ